MISDGSGDCGFAQLALSKLSLDCLVGERIGPTPSPQPRGTGGASGFGLKQRPDAANRRDVVIGINTAWPTHLDEGGSRANAPLGEQLRGRWTPNPDDHRRNVIIGELLMPEERVGRDNCTGMITQTRL